MLPNQAICSCNLLGILRDNLYHVGQHFNPNFGQHFYPNFKTSPGLWYAIQIANIIFEAVEVDMEKAPLLGDRKAAWEFPPSSVFAFAALAFLYSYFVRCAARSSQERRLGEN